MPIRVECAEKLIPLLTKPKRIKVAVGGRSSSKSTAFGDAFLRKCDAGQRLCCAREFQNSVAESVHSQLTARIQQLGASLRSDATGIYSRSGGEIFYRGLARNISAFKSTYGLKALWIEEGQTLSEETIETVLPTVRSAPGTSGDPPEIWISANRGASNDAFSRHFLRPYEKELAANGGYYEDDDIIIVQINYYENPFFPPDMEQQRQRDFRIMPRARYDHVWLGKYSDTIKNAIIMPEWFDACVDAHLKLGFKPIGRETISHDPSDGGDPAAYIYRHGNVIMAAELGEKGMEINDAADWATDVAVEVSADMFIWDGDGMGAGLRDQVKRALTGKRCQLAMFKGSMTSSNPGEIYQPIDGEMRKEATNGATFANQRAQYYWRLRDRMFRTYLAVTRREYHNPDDLISLSSRIDVLDLMRSELCRIPRKPGGRIQILSKPDMKKAPYKLDSPNLADCVMMSEAADDLAIKYDVARSAVFPSNQSGGAAGWT